MVTQEPYERLVFSNGARLILVPMAGVNSVATGVMVACGSRYETPQVNGISHFLEHMVFKGTKKYPTTDDVNVLERQGGLQNAYTDIDITNYHNKVLSTDWKLALDINKELALKPLLKEVYIERERNVILEEMKRYEDEPEIKVEETFHQLLYPSTALGMRIIGEEASLRHISAKELHEYHDAWYQPSRLVVVLAGNLEPQISKIAAQTEKWFVGLKSNKTQDFAKVKDQQEQSRLKVVTKPDAQQAHLVLGVRTFPRGSRDRFAWNIFNLLMGVSFTSRLFKEIREKRGLCYHIRSTTNFWADVGNWSIYAGVATTKVSEAVSAILGELAKARDKGVSEEEIKVAKKRFKTMMAFKSEDPEFMAEYYGRQELFGEPVLTLAEHLARIEAVSQEEVNRLTQKYLRRETLNLALVWNKSPDPALEKLLKL